MKIEYKFNKFQDMYKKHLVDNSIMKPILHYFEDEALFILLFRNKEHVDTYTIVEKNTIIEFGQSYTQDNTEAINDFRINYLSNAINIINNPIDLTESEVSEILSEPITKAIDDAGDEVVDESKDYADFISKTIKGWEDKVMNAIDRIDKDYTNKTFGEFLSSMMNTVNSMPFMGKLRKYIKASMIEGIEAAENETGIQVGFSADASDKLKSLEHQQLNGYTLPDGKPWYGIKGATNEMKFNILKAVENGVKDKKTNKEIKEDVKNIFKTASNAQADRIARTETTRFISESKIMAFKESGLEGYKVWRAVNDSKTSAICRNLNGTKKEYDEPFIDINGVAHQGCPGHVQCRCVIEWAPKEKK